MKQEFAKGSVILGYSVADGQLVEVLEVVKDFRLTKKMMAPDGVCIDPVVLLGRGLVKATDWEVVVVE